MVLFSDERISEHITRVNTPFGVCVYLVQGKERALLVDTGMGVGDLKGHIASLTDLPYEAVLTHGHCDHAGGSVQFAKVWLNEKDFALEKRHNTKAHRISDVRNGLSQADVADDMFLASREAPYESLTDDAVFDLSGVKVSFISAPGHTAGTMVPVIAEDHAAIIGDGLTDFTLLHFPESLSVQTYLSSVRRLKSSLADIDTLLSFHGRGYCEKQIISDMEQLCLDIMDHKDKAIRINLLDYDGVLARAFDHPGTFGNLLYNPEKICTGDE